MSAKVQSKKRTAPDSAGGKAKAFKKSFSNGNGNAPSGRTGKPAPRFAGGANGAPKWKDNGNKWKDNGKSNNYKGKAEPKEEIKRRKRPVTMGGGSEDEDMGEDDDEQEGYEEVAAEPDGRDVDVPAAAGEKKPRMTKTERAALHAAQPHRTALLPSHPLLHDTLLPLWETARRADLSKEERRKAVSELYQSVKGRVGEVSKGHKGGRVLQTIVKWGGKEERLGVAMELEGRWREMMESKYSKFLMSKLIRYCPSIRPLLIPVLAPHLTSILSHSDAVQPLSDFFDLHASSRERRLLVRGFYPREVKLFDGAGKGKNAEVNVKGLEGSLEEMGDGKARERILEGIEKTVLDIFNATQKTALAQGIFHRLVLEYLVCIYRFLPQEAADEKMHELLTAALESLPEIVHTKDGSSVVRELIVHGNAKDRKQILQNLRKHVEAMCKDGDAQLVLFTALDCVDDTKLMGKAFVADITALTSTLASDKNGRRALLYLLTPTSTRHFLPSTLSSLAESAKAARELGTSKKDPATRRKELVAYASPGFLQAIEEGAEALVRDAGAGLVVQEIMLHCEGDKSKAIAALVEPLRVPYTPSSPSDEPSDHPHILSPAHTSRTYKLLLTGGHFHTATKTVQVIDPSLSAPFAQAFWDAATSEEAGGEENVRRMAEGEGMFVVAELVGALGKEAGKAEVVKRAFPAEWVRKVEKSGRRGASVLVEKIGEL